MPINNVLKGVVFMDSNKENSLAKEMNRYIKSLSERDLSYRNKEALDALRRTRVVTVKGTLRKKIVSS